MSSRIAVLILAAGSSSRLGRPKQLLPYNDTTLLGHIIRECNDSKLGEVIVVLGSKAEEIASHVDNKSCRIIENTDWQNGMGSSIAYGISQLDDQSLKGVIIVLSDQLYFQKELLREIVRVQERTQAKIVNSDYGSSQGPPVYFHYSLFHELVELKGEKGAASIIKTNKESSTRVSFPHGDIDIDVPTDLEYLNREFRSNEQGKKSQN